MKKFIIISILIFIALCSISFADTYDAGSNFTPTLSNVTYSLSNQLVCDNITVGKWCFNITGGPNEYNYCNISATPIVIYILNYPILLYTNITPTSPTDSNNLQIWATVTDVDLGNTLTTYTQMYNGSTTFGNVNEANVSNNIRKNIYNLSSNYTAVNEIWTAEIWATDGTTNTSKVNVSVTIQESDTPQDDIRTYSAVLTGVMAVLILAAIIIPIGVLIIFLKGDMDWVLAIAAIATMIGLAIVIMVFYFIRAALINAVG